MMRVNYLQLSYKIRTDNRCCILANYFSLLQDFRRDLGPTAGIRFRPASIRNSKYSCFTLKSINLLSLLTAYDPGLCNCYIYIRCTAQSADSDFTVGISFVDLFVVQTTESTVLLQRVDCFWYDFPVFSLLKAQLPEEYIRTDKTLVLHKTILDCQFWCTSPSKLLSVAVFDYR